MAARRISRQGRAGRKRLRRAGAARVGAQRQLRRFAQASLLAIAVTAFLLLLVGLDEGMAQEVPLPAGDAVRADDVAAEATEAARETFQNLWHGFVAALPQVLVVIFVFLLAWGIVRLIRPLLRRATGSLQKGPAITAIFGIAVWLLAIGISISVMVGDLRALLGSIGLIGLALSWALQTPIESFTGWLMNSFQGYYRLGDRIAVGEVFGDVVRIDFLTTTVWEYGGIDRAPSGIAAEQPTGRMITFPNNEVLAGSIVNYTRDFPYVWDELAIAVAAESDLSYARVIVEGLAHDLLAEQMEMPAAQYRAILDRTRVSVEISSKPEVFVTLTASGVDLVVRYLVGARERRIWKSRLTEQVVTELNRDEHRGRILPLYPRQQVQFVGEEGAPLDWREISPRP
jgi:small-conductance mechanosensitive channel